MKALLRLAMGVLLTELTFGFSAHTVAENGLPGDGNGKGSAPGIALNASWRLGAPVRFENLTVFPVIGDESPDVGGFITLDEGLRSGKVTLTEIGAKGRVRRIGAGRQASDDAEVNKLMLTNRSGKTLILIAGEMVVGGKQDRIVGHDCLVASNNIPVRLDVFCVEPGRWNEDAAFGQSRRVEQASASNVRRTTRGRTGRSGGSNWSLGGGNAGVSGSAAFMPAAGLTIAPSNVREKAQASKDQTGVWAEVAKTEHENNTSSATGNLNAVFADKQVSTRLEDYQRAFANTLTGKNVVGVVVAVGGKLRSADVFATHSLFGIYWPKLLKSYSLEAASSGRAIGESISASAAEAFLSRAEGAKSPSGKARTYRLIEHQSDKDASFELVNSSKPSLSLIHFNRVTKQ
ncbi:MAG TPA: DUF6569 family protein [Blastocatellia bacterium]|jgi:hypothetical protein|nr:DUF6569 family protein [Blastocatellia bacterium]